MKDFEGKKGNVTWTDGKRTDGFTVVLLPRGGLWGVCPPDKLVPIDGGERPMDPIERIERATAVASEKVKGVKSADMPQPTPCSEFDVHGLLNHMLGGLSMLAVAAKGGKAAMPNGDQVGASAGDTYDARRTELLEAVRIPGSLERNWEMPFGSMAGQMMAGIAFMEHLTHAWDVAKATGQDTTLPADLVAECIQLVTPMDAMLRTPGVCGPAVKVPDTASAQDKLIAFMGRTP